MKTLTPLPGIDRFFRTDPHGDRRYLLANAVCFQISWLLCVLGGSWIALAVTTVVVTLHLRIVRESYREGFFLAQCAAIGFACDLTLVQTGVLTTSSGLPPLWLTCLWVLFGTTIGYSMRIFHGRLWFGVVGGAAFAPLSYFAGARLADIPLMQPTWLALMVVSAIWAIIFPLLIHLYSVNRLRINS